MTRLRATTPVFHSLGETADRHFGVQARRSIIEYAEAVDPPRPDSKEMVTLEPERVHIFLDAAHDTPYFVPFYTALYTGLRRAVNYLD